MHALDKFAIRPVVCTAVDLSASGCAESESTSRVSTVCRPHEELTNLYLIGCSGYAHDVRIQMRYHYWLAKLVLYKVLSVYHIQVHCRDNDNDTRLSMHSYQLFDREAR